MAKFMINDILAYLLLTSTPAQDPHLLISNDEVPCRLRADRVAYYYGYEMLWETHPNVVSVLAKECPELLEPLLDGHMWHSRCCCVVLCCVVLCCVVFVFRRSLRVALWHAWRTADVQGHVAMQRGRRGHGPRQLLRRLPLRVRPLNPHPETPNPKPETLTPPAPPPSPHTARTRPRKHIRGRKQEEPHGVAHIEANSHTPTSNTRKHLRGPHCLEMRFVAFDFGVGARDPDRYTEVWESPLATLVLAGEPDIFMHPLVRPSTLAHQETLNPTPKAAPQPPCRTPWRGGLKAIR
jgi:hypothetical protein